VATWPPSSRRQRQPAVRDAGGGHVPEGDLADLLARLATETRAPDGEAPEVQQTTGGAAYRRSGRPFAIVRSRSLDIRLRPDVAEAARRTPDVTASEQGPAWVRFTPATLDRYALDRATAWFEFGWRHAAD